MSTAAQLKAYAAVKPKAPTMRQRILDFIKTDGNTGFTADEVADGTGWQICSVRARFFELRTEGLIRSTGEQRLFKNNVKPSKVWVAA